MKNLFASACLIYVVFLILGAIGWVMNAVKLIHLMIVHAPVDGIFLARIVGAPIFFIGAFLGWF